MINTTLPFNKEPEWTLRDNEILHVHITNGKDEVYYQEDGYGVCLNGRDVYNTFRQLNTLALTSPIPQHIIDQYKSIIKLGHS